MPSINPTESCDIYGPLCQTGSIAVGVKANNQATTTTTVPCSCYLTAQSLTVNPTSTPWQVGFGRSDQCYSLLRIRYTPTLALNAPIYSNCPKGQFSAGVGNAGFPVLNATMPRLPEPETGLVMEDSGSCCGQCDSKIARVKILFFPGPRNSTCGKKASTASQSATKPSITPAPHPSVVHRALYPRGNASIAVSNGFTL